MRPQTKQELANIHQLLQQMNITVRDLLPSISLAALSSLARLIELRLMIALLSGMVYKSFSPESFGRILQYVPFISKQPSYLITLSFMVGSFLLFAMASSQLTYLSNISVQKKMRLLERRLRTTIFKRYLELGKGFFDKKGFPNLQGVLIRNTHSAAEALNSLHQLTSSVFMLFAYAAILLIIEWKMAILTMVLFGGITIAAYAWRQREQHISAEQTKSQWFLDKKIFHIINCIPLVQAHRQEQYELDNFEQVNKEELNIAYAIQRHKERDEQIQNTVNLFALIAIALVFIFLPSHLLQVSATRIISFLLVVRLMTPQLQSISNFGATLQKTHSPLKNILNILGKQNDRYLVPEGNKVLKTVRENIVFQHVTFGYDAHAPVLHDVSFTVPKQSMTAIVGGSGSGKTTLAHLLLRFYDPQEGSILIDGTDIQEYTLSSLRNIVGLVSQDIYLFNDTFRHNMSYGAGVATDDVIQDTLMQVQLDDLIDQFPEGLDTIIGDYGTMLSGGERQRTSIARSLLRQSEILILDEPSSALDSKTERHIQSCIEDRVSNTTLLVIAHRLSTIQHADNIVVLEKGMVVEQGTFAELLKHRGVLYGYYEQQKLMEEQTGVASEHLVLA